MLNVFVADFFKKNQQLAKVVMSHLVNIIVQFALFMTMKARKRASTIAKNAESAKLVDVIIHTTAMAVIVVTHYRFSQIIYVKKTF